MPPNRYIDGSRILPQSIQPDRIVGLFVKPPGGATRPTRPGETPVTPMPELVFNVDLLLDQSISGIKIATNAIGHDHLIDGAVDAAKLAEGSVYADALQDGAVDLGSSVCTGNLAADRIAAGVLSAGVVYAGQIAAEQIHAGTINSDVIWGGTIGTDQLVAGSALIGDALIGSISAEKITAGRISAAVEMTSPTIRYAKETFGSTTPGFWIGRYPYASPTGYGINIGDATRSIKWDSATGELSITGGHIRTGATGPRVEIAEDTEYDTGGVISFYTDDPLETSPGTVDGTAWYNIGTPSVSGSLRLRSMSFNSKIAASIHLQSESADGSSPPGIYMFLNDMVFSIEPTEDGHRKCTIWGGWNHGVGLKSLSTSDTLQVRTLDDSDYAPIAVKTIALTSEAGAAPGSQMRIGGYPMRLAVNSTAKTALWQVYAGGSWRSLGSASW